MGREAVAQRAELVSRHDFRSNRGNELSWD
jgi:hypothetical protein